MTNTSTIHRPSELEDLDCSWDYTPAAFQSTVANLPGGEHIGTRWYDDPRVLLHIEQDDENPVCTAILGAFRFQQVRGRGSFTVSEWVAIVPRIAAQMLTIEHRYDTGLRTAETLELDGTPRTTVESLVAADEVDVLSLIATLMGRTQWLEFDEVCHLADVLVELSSRHGVPWTHVLELAGDIDDIDTEELHTMLAAAYAAA